jgi:hypothetical protein
MLVHSSLYTVAVLRMRDVSPGARIRIFPSPIEGQKDSGSALKNLSILTQKTVRKRSEKIICDVRPGSRGQKSTATMHIKDRLLPVYRFQKVVLYFLIFDIIYCNIGTGMFQDSIFGEFGIFVIAIEITDKAFKKVPAKQIPTDPDPLRYGFGSLFGTPLVKLVRICIMNSVDIDFFLFLVPSLFISI